MVEDEENPYAAPAPAGVDVLHLGEGEPLADPRGRGWIAVTLLWILCLLGVLPLVLMFLSAGDPIDPSVKGPMETAWVITFLATVTMICVWTYRCATNAQVLNGRRLDTSPGMAVASYFIPFYNLWGPFAAMQAICAITYEHSPRPKPSFAIHFWWWTGWVAFNVLSNFSERMGSERVAVVSLVAMLISAAMLTVLIVKLSAAQAELTVPAKGIGQAGNRAALKSSRLPAIEAALPKEPLPQLSKPDVPLPAQKPAGPRTAHPNAPVPRRPGVTPLPASTTDGPVA